MGSCASVLWIPFMMSTLGISLFGIAVILTEGPIQLFGTGSERINWTVNAEQCACLRSMSRCQVCAVISGSFGHSNSGGCGASLRALFNS